MTPIHGWRGDGDATDGFMNADGIETQELLPKTHRFRVTYGGTTKTVSVAISGNTTVVFSVP